MDRSERITASLQAVTWAALLAIVLAGCTAARSSSPETSASSTSSASKSTQVPQPVSSETPSAAAEPTVTPRIGGVIHWTQLDLPAGLAATPDSSTQTAFFGWSKGYVGLSEGFKGEPTVPWTSLDGRSWRKGNALDTTGLTGDTWVSQMVEGPAGLLAVGMTAGCADDGEGCAPASAKAMWISSDGRTWNRIDMPKAFGGRQVGDVSAGPKGYMAVSVSTDDATAAPAVWLSGDGRSWRSVAVPAATFDGAFLAGGAVTTGGYVVAGRVGSVAGWGGGYFPSTTPAIWWSADGVTWSRVALNGITAAPQAEAAVTKITDHTLVAHVVKRDSPVPPDGATETWSSDDGRMWNPAGPGFPAPAVVLSDGRRAVELVPTDAGVTAATSADGFAWTQCAIDGVGPADWDSAALGTGGLLVAATGGAWLGAIS